MTFQKRSTPSAPAPQSAWARRSRKMSLQMARWSISMASTRAIVSVNLTTPESMFHTRTRLVGVRAGAGAGARAGARARARSGSGGRDRGQVRGRGRVRVARERAPVVARGGEQVAPAFGGVGDAEDILCVARHAPVRSDEGGGLLIVAPHDHLALGLGLGLGLGLALGLALGLGLG